MRACESYMKQQTGYRVDSLNAPEIMDSCAAALRDASQSGSTPILDNWSIKWSKRRFILVIPFCPTQTEARTKAK